MVFVLYKRGGWSVKNDWQINVETTGITGLTLSTSGVQDLVFQVKRLESTASAHATPEDLRKLQDLRRIAQFPARTGEECTRAPSTRADATALSIHPSEAVLLVSQAGKSRSRSNPQLCLAWARR